VRSVETRSEQRVGFTGGIRNIPGSCEYEMGVRPIKKIRRLLGRVREDTHCSFFIGTHLAISVKERSLNTLQLNLFIRLEINLEINFRAYNMRLCV